jgi:cytochrome c peroxidase
MSNKENLRMKTNTKGSAGVALRLAVPLGLMTLLAVVTCWAGNPAAPLSLKTIPRPEPNDIGIYVKNRAAAIALGKSLFWDMQLGSDGVQACASCHFHAGADIRTKNIMNPGPDGNFLLTGPNGTVTPDMFPFTKFLDAEDRFSPILSDVNVICGAQGVHNTTFVDVPKPGTIAELGKIVPDSTFQVGGFNTRRVTGRNAPSVINAVFNFNNFYDGRANNIFNGCSPFGDSDPTAANYVNDAGGMSKVRLRILMSSLASQSVGPPGNPTEMAFAGRTWPKIGKRLLTLRPLQQQVVHPKDSVLGKLAVVGGTGLNANYPDMIKAAFQDKWWNNTTQVVSVANNGTASIVPTPAKPSTNQFSQMEINFSLFFGLAVQMYEATLVSDDSPFDRFQAGNNNAMSASAQAGLNTFLTSIEPGQVGGSCINCHGGPEFTNGSVSHVGVTNFGASLPEGLIELMVMGDANGGSAFYDAGYYNIGVRPTEEDLGRGGDDPFGFPLSFTKRALLVQSGTVLPFPNPPLTNPSGGPITGTRAAVNGAFKVPSLRNVELTGPYFHNGSAATLAQVIDHYTRGGSFHEHNLHDLDPDIQAIQDFKGNDLAQRQVIDFLISLTDERVRFERAPFDHPELFIPHGAVGDANHVSGVKSQALDETLHIPAVGAGGLTTPIGTFMGLDPHVP